MTGVLKVEISLSCLLLLPIAIAYCYCLLLLPIAIAYCYCLLLLPTAFAHCYCLLLLLIAIWALEALHPNVGV